MKKKALLLLHVWQLLLAPTTFQGIDTMTSEDATPSASRIESLLGLGHGLLDFLTIDLGVPNGREFRRQTDDFGQPVLIIELRNPGDMLHEDPPQNYGTLYVKMSDHPWWNDPAVGDLVHLRIDEPGGPLDFLESVIAGASNYRETVFPAVRRLLKQVEDWCSGDAHSEED